MVRRPAVPVALPICIPTLTDHAALITTITGAPVVTVDAGAATAHNAAESIAGSDSTTT